jgi:predicted RecB family nuclease
MQKIGDSIIVSASDLVGHLNCLHLTGLDTAVANGTLEKPEVWDPLLQLLWERGARHEQAFVDHLKSQGFSVTVIDGIGIDEEAIARTREAMAAGEEVIVQGAFRLNGWVGRTDILRRVETTSDLGAWSYEVIDTKLARETKGGTVLQLCLYSDLVASVQGTRPTFGYVVAPWSDFVPQAYRIDDYLAYCRRVQSGLEAAIGERGTTEIYPDPKEHCDTCRWQDRCDKRRRADDHLSLVAGITKVHIDELKRHGVETTAALAAMALPMTWKPTRGAAQSYNRVREQARIQVEGREAGAVLYELLPVVPGFGLATLREPSPGDIFFDLEGDPFAGEGGLEYLFGYVFSDKEGNDAYTADWAFNPLPACQLSVIQRFNVLCDRSQIRIGCDNLEVAARNPLAPQFAHFGYRLATDKAAELRKKAPLTTGEQSPEAFPDCHILSSKPARRIRALRHKKHIGLWAEGAGLAVRNARKLSVRFDAVRSQRTPAPLARRCPRSRNYLRKPTFDRPHGGLGASIREPVGLVCDRCHSRCSLFVAEKRLS